MHFNLKEWIAEWKRELKENTWLIILAIVLIITANVLNVVASSYTDRVGDVHVNDVILDNIPTVDLSPIFAYGFTFILCVFFLYPGIFKVKRMHVIIGQFSLLVMIRSFFIILTHLQQPANAIITNLPEYYSLLTFKNDLFFSMHVAASFLGFLLFRENKIVGTFFAIATITMAITVLFMHVHYSIDVFAAFFITYGCYKIGNMLF